MFLEKCDKLESIYCAQNNIESLNKIPQLEQLKTLHIRDNSLRYLIGINKFKQLKYFNIRKNRLSKYEDLISLLKLD